MRNGSCWALVAALIVLASPLGRAEAQSVDQVDRYADHCREIMHGDPRRWHRPEARVRTICLLSAVIALRDGGVELEFDSPNDPVPDEPEQLAVS